MGTRVQGLKWMLDFDILLTVNRMETSGGLALFWDHDLDVSILIL